MLGGFGLLSHSAPLGNISQNIFPVQVSVLLSLTSGTLTTSYDTSCAISTNYWTITQCMMRTMREGEERRELEEERKEGEGREDGDNWNKNTGGLSENTCRVIDINPERLETVVKLENLQPCTQYSFTLYTRHVVGEQGKEIMEEKVITEMTQCQGRQPIMSHLSYH